MINIDDRLIKETLPKIKPNGLAVLLAISIHLNKESGTCFPSHDRLMKLTGLGSDSVYNALSVLKKEGLLVSIQAIDSKNKTFSRRTFRIETDFIGVFVTAKNAAPLPEPLRDLPDTAKPDAVEPDAANHETYLLNESQRLNEVEQLNNTNKIDVAVFDPEVNALIVDSLEFKADAFPPTPIAPPPAPQSYGEWMRSDPPAPRRFEAFDIDKEERMFLGAEDAMQRYARETGTPREKMYFGFQDAVKAFTADQKTTGYNYNNAIDYRKHFFNLVRRKAEIARNGQRAQPGASSAQSNSPVPTNIRRL